VHKSQIAWYRESSEDCARKANASRTHAPAWESLAKCWERLAQDCEAARTLDRQNAKAPSAPTVSRSRSFAR
jgi:hypothetical protein